MFGPSEYRGRKKKENKPLSAKQTYNKVKYAAANSPEAKAKRLAAREKSASAGLQNAEKAFSKWANRVNETSNPQAKEKKNEIVRLLQAIANQKRIAYQDEDADSEIIAYAGKIDGLTKTAGISPVFLKHYAAKQGVKLTSGSIALLRSSLAPMLIISKAAVGVKAAGRYVISPSDLGLYKDRDIVAYNANRKSIKKQWERAKALGPPRPKKTLTQKQEENIAKFTASAKKKKQDRLAKLASPMVDVVSRW